jgi:hypothetical protein
MATSRANRPRRSSPTLAVKPKLWLSITLFIVTGVSLFYIFVRQPIEAELTKRTLLMNSARDAVAKTDGWNSGVVVEFPSRQGAVWAVRVVRATSHGEDVRMLRIQDDGRVINYSKVTP